MKNNNIKIVQAIIPGNRPEDYFLGVNSVIKHEARNTTRDWRPFYSRDERQSLANGDTYACTNFSGANQWEIEANFFLVNKLWPQDALNFWNKYGYIVNNKFEISDRFQAIKSGTKVGLGNYMYKGHDSIRKDGVIPESMLPTTSTMKVEEFYSGVTPEMEALGLQSLKYFNWMYEFLSDLSTQAIDKALEHAPLQIGIGICEGYYDGFAELCSAGPTHAIIEGDIEDMTKDHNVLDHYDPFKKRLQAGYKIHTAVKGVLYPIKRDDPASLPQTFTRDIEFGEQSVEVLKLRKVLNEHGWKNNINSDVYDKELAMVVFRFQLANLSRTLLDTIFSLVGRRVGPQTRYVLNQYALGKINMNKKFYLSSANPNELAMTIKGLLLSVVPLILLVTKTNGFTEVGEAELNTFIEGVVNAIIAITGAVAALQVVYGSLRKVYYWWVNK